MSELVAADPTGTSVPPDGDEVSRRVDETHVLIVEDSSTHAKILDRFLSSSAATSSGFGTFRSTRAKTLDEAGRLVEALDDLAVISLDLTLPDSQGLATYLRMREIAPDLPIVVMTGLDDDQLAFDALRHGAQDYVLKSKSSALSFVRTLNFAIERHRLTRALEQALEERNAHAQQLRDVVGMASHELLGPLTTIGGLSATLVARWELLDDAQRLDLVNRMDARFGQAIDVARSFLDVARTADGTIEVSTKEINVRDSVEAAVGDPDVTISGDADVTVLADRSHLQSCVRNLVSNARKYGDPPVEVVISHHGATVEVAIRDHGPGVPDHLQATLFDRFTHDSAGRQVDSHGLGLFIVRQLVEANGGGIDYETRPTGGASFNLHFPAA